jgi:hypothetical protein
MYHVLVLIMLTRLNPQRASLYFSYQYLQCTIVVDDCLGPWAAQVIEVEEHMNISLMPSLASTIMIQRAQSLLIHTCSTT